MAAYRRVYDSRHLQADCQEPGSAPEPYARQSSMGYLYLFTAVHGCRSCIEKSMRYRIASGDFLKTDLRSALFKSALSVIKRESKYVLD